MKLPPFEVDVMDDGKILVDLISEGNSSLEALDVWHVAIIHRCSHRPCLPTEEGENRHWIDTPGDWHIFTCELVAESVKTMLYGIISIRAMVAQVERKKAEV